MTTSTQRRTALEAVRKACLLCQAVQAEWLRGGEATTKEDRSPVTVADYGAQAVISLSLARLEPRLPIVGEESAAALRRESASVTRAEVTRHVRALVPDASEAAILDAIDACADRGGASGRRWVLDPIDGTKGYLRRGQYAVALALLDEGTPTLGILGCPSLRSADGAREGSMFVAEGGQGAFEIGLEDAADADEVRIRVADLEDPAAAAFCESVETEHSAHDRHAAIAARLGVSAPPVRMDSQCKYGVVARGEAAIYLRLPRTESYREKIWDHAAGCLVVTEAGGRVTDVDGRELDFGQGRTLLGNRGIVATNGRLHDRVLAAIDQTAPQLVVQRGAR